MPRERAPIFSSFWMAGFESSCHIARRGRLDMIAATQHDRFVADDYDRLLQFGMRSIRDSARWHLIERAPASFEFDSLAPMVAAARQRNMQVVWDLCHYGWPDGLDIFTPAFVDRFARYCGAVAGYLLDQGDGVRLYTPINEISFFAWAAGEVGWFYPFAHHRGDEIKRQLVRATIAGIEAIWDKDPEARIVTVEPVIHVVAPVDRPDLAEEANRYRNSQFEAWDMLSGALAPELGGAPKYVDVIGVNFYHDNQWEQPGGRKLGWHIHPRDPRWRPFHLLLREVYDRYRRPIFIAETSHVGSGRAEWLRELTDEVVLAIHHGVPLEGICLYPILDRFEWEDPTHWHNSGLWDFDEESDGTYRRVLNAPYAQQVRISQTLVP